MSRFAAALLAAAFAASPALAQSPFDGTWKTDVSTIKVSPKPDVFSVRNGVYTCESCVPRVEVIADKADHAVTGHPYYDQVAVAVVDDRTIRVARRHKGKLMFVGESKVSPDGKLLSFAFKDTSGANGQIVTGRGSQHRVGPVPAGAHAVSGSWVTDKLEGISDAGVTLTLKTSGDTLHAVAGTGETYDAHFGGPAVPVSGDPGHTMAAVKRLSPTAFQETDMRDGKVVGVMTLSVDPGGKTASLKWEDRVHGTTETSKMKKQ